MKFFVRGNNTFIPNYTTDFLVLKCARAQGVPYYDLYVCGGMLPLGYYVTGDLIFTGHSSPGVPNHRDNGLNGFK